MDTKTLTVLEYPKILERLARHCDFSASKELALDLTPDTSIEWIRSRLAETSEARRLLSTSDVTLGGAHDIRESVELGRRGGTIEPMALLDIKSTLLSCRNLKKILEKQVEQYPHLAELAFQLPDTYGIVEAVSRVLSDQGEILDSASARLGSIRKELRTSYERLMSKLQKYLTGSDTASMLQEAIITQRDGRYVIPLRAQFKGKVKSIIHDQSSSGQTLFVEPLPVVELNNKYRELQLAERDEEQRILSELSNQIGEHADEIIPGIEALAELDLAFGKAKYAEDTEASEPILFKPENRKPGVENRNRSRVGKSGGNQNPEIIDQPSVISLKQARHPLLDPKSVVPINFNPSPETRAVVITGPNTGGKTVSLKTVGLLVLMAQAGLHIPAQSGSGLPVFEQIYADIGDEQSIEQSLSTFSSHVTSIISILKAADENTLVILDELGAGTDPAEGAALARAILSYLLERGITTLVTTHHPELKAFAHTTAGVVNASVEFNVQTLRPTYQLTIGLPGRSNALAIAKRLGLPEEILAAARADVNPEDQQTDKMLNDIRRERNRTSREREKARKARQKVDQEAQKLEQRMEEIEKERQEIIARARAEAELEVEVLKHNIKTLKEHLHKARQPLEAVKEIETAVEQVEEKIAPPAKANRQPSPRAGLTRPLAVGDTVHLYTLNAEGSVTALGEEDAEVQVGALRMRARLEDMSRPQAADNGQEQENTKVKAKQHKPTDNKSSVVKPPSAVVPKMEINLRGKTVDEALHDLEHYLDKAYAAGMPFVRIIHGKGTGALRQAVREVLRDHPYVTSFEEAASNEGGAGATVAKIS
ncbi:MAG: Smr/MutS family protein [Anaerolineales bacterium]|nr:Smr/MutS family protein [Anaerolineales bacterium]